MLVDVLKGHATGERQEMPVSGMRVGDAALGTPIKGRLVVTVRILPVLVSSARHMFFPFLESGGGLSPHRR